MKARTIQNHLNACSKAELVQMLLDLAGRHPAVERFLVAKFDPTAPVLDFEDYKAEVRREFFPPRGFGNGSPSIAFRMLQRVEAEATSPKQVIDFIYYCVETGVEFTAAYGDIDEEYYLGFEDLFERAGKLAATEKLINEYKPQARRIVKSTYEMGWGFYEELERILSEYFAATDGS
jgi:hypothetical protein